MWILKTLAKIKFCCIYQVLSFHWYSQLLESQQKQRGKCRGRPYVSNVLKRGTETLSFKHEGQVGKACSIVHNCSKFCIPTEQGKRHANKAKGRSHKKPWCKDSRQHNKDLNRQSKPLQNSHMKIWHRWSGPNVLEKCKKATFPEVIKN